MALMGGISSLYEAARKKLSRLELRLVTFLNKGDWEALLESIERMDVVLFIGDLLTTAIESLEGLLNWVMAYRTRDEDFIFLGEPFS